MENMRMENITISTAKPLDKQALVEIYEQYSPAIFRYASRLLDDSYLAEECVSETFSRFLRSIRGGAQPENVRAYLYRAAHNWIIDCYRKQPPLPDILLEEDFQSPDAEGNPAQMVSTEMERQRVRTAILRLPAEQRQVIELRFIEEWSHDEVAAAIGKTVEATRALQHRAVSALRQMLA
jgi:RNA polymerase sigma-70 factor (ECF subfamily)